jgi:hypothetical protein
MVLTWKEYAGLEFCRCIDFSIDDTELLESFPVRNNLLMVLCFWDFLPSLAYISFWHTHILLVLILIWLLTWTSIESSIEECQFYEEILGNFTLPWDVAKEVIAYKQPHQFPDQLKWMGRVISHTDMYLLHYKHTVLLFVVVILVRCKDIHLSSTRMILKALHMTIMAFVWFL